MPSPGFIQRTRMTYGDYSFSPVPTFSWTTDLVRDNLDNLLYKIHSLDFAGVLLPNPSNSGQLDEVVDLQDQLRAALASGNQELIISFDGAPVLSGVFPVIENVSMEEGVWADRTNYTFSAFYDEDVDANGIKSFSETWSFQEDEDRRSATVSHAINAVGLNTNPSGISNALINAKDYVTARTGYSNAVANAPFFVQVSGASFNAYEELRNEQHDIQAGGFSVNENFVLSSGTFINTRTSQYSEDADGVVTVSVNGQVRGLGRGDDAFERAIGAWDASIKDNLKFVASGTYVQFAGPADLFTNNTESFSVTKNEFAGTLDYSVSYNDSPGENLPAGIQEFNLSVTTNLPTRIHPTFLIPKRAAGPIVQDALTTKPGTHVVAGNAIGKSSADFGVVLSYVNLKLQENKGPGFITSHSITKDERNKTVNFNITWEFTSDLNAAADTIAIVQ